MAAEIEFVPGKFQTFRAIAKIHLGKLAMDLREGDIVQFDGQTIRIGGAEHNYPELRGGIRVGWVVPEKDNISNYAPKSANVKVRAAQDKGTKAKNAPTTISDDEKYVGPARPKMKVVREEDQEPESTEVSSFSRTLKNQDVEERAVGPSRKTASAGGNEDAKPIGKIRTPAIQKTVISDGAQAAREASRLDNAPPPRAILASKKGTDIHAAEAEKVETIIDALNPEDRARMVREQRAAQTKAAEKAAPPAPPHKTPGKMVPSKAQKVEEEAKAASKAPAKAPAKGSPPKAKAPVKPKTPRTIEEVVLAGDEIDLGDGIKWDMKIHWLSRVKLAADLYEKKGSEAFERVLAIEVPSVVTHARKNLAFRLKAKGEA